LALPAAIDPAALAGHDPTAAVVALDGETMGTSWRVLYAEVPHRPPAAIRAAIEARLADLVAQLSHWAPDSALCRFNRAAAGEWVTLPADLARVMDVALRLAQASDGAFDPAIGRLVDVWGYGPPGPMPAPSDAEIGTALGHSGYRRLARNGRQLRQPGGVALDLSGIGKGHAVDAIADLLARHDIRHCMVEIGGELVGRGLRPDGDPWWVDLEGPMEIALPPLRVALHQLAVATSGTYRRGDHNLDPRTGRPPASGVVAASVIAPTAMLADALASAVTISFPDLTLLTRLNIAARLIVVRDGCAQEVVTARLAAMMTSDAA
jgi:thiamine biosynthesis lipoprotein